MPLPAPRSERTLRHTRSMTFEVHERADGLFDLDAHLTDVKPDPVPFLDHVNPAGRPVHDMWLRVTLDRKLNVVDAVSALDNVPHAGQCEGIGPDYARLIGLNLMRGFRQGVRERFGDTGRCTHVNELANNLPTIVVQGLFHTLVRNVSATRKPLPIDKCHAQVSHGEVVRRLYPMWYQPRAAGAATNEENP